MAKNRKIRGVFKNTPMLPANTSIELSPVKTTENSLAKYGIFVGFIFVFVVFTIALKNNFVRWDDQLYVFENDLIMKPNVENFKKIFFVIVEGNYHPITMLSLFLNSLLLGKEAFGFILVNILIHCVNTFLIYRLSLKISNKVGIAIVVAIIWGVHPLHAEAVVWVSERKGLLSTLFYILGMLSYVRYIEINQNKYYAFTWLWFVMACLSKATAASFPAILILLDYWYDKPFLSFAYLKNKIGLVLFSLLIIWISSNVQSGGDFFGVFYLNRVGFNALNIKELSNIDNVLFGSYGFCVYVLKLIFPFNLHHFYLYPIPSERRALQYILAPIFLLLCLGICWFAYRKGNKKYVFGFLLFFISILPVLKFVSISNSIFSERYSYFPYWGLIIFLVILIDQKIANKQIKIGIASVFILFCTVQTIRYIPKWNNTLSLWENNYQYEKTDLITSITLVKLYEQEDKVKLNEIMNICHQLEKMGHIQPVVFDHLATGYYLQDNKQQALYYMNKAIQNENVKDYIALDQVEAYHKRGKIQQELGNYQASIDDFTKAYSLDSTKTASIVLRSVSYLKLNRFKDVIHDYTLLINKKTPPLDTLYNDRGGYKYKIGDVQGAIEDFRAALKINHNFSQSQDNLKVLGVKL